MSSSPLGDDINPYQSPQLASPLRSRISATESVDRAEIERLVDVMRRTRLWVGLVSVVLFLAAVPMGVMFLIGLMTPALRFLFNGYLDHDDGRMLGNAVGQGVVFMILIMPARYLWAYFSRIQDFADSQIIRPLEEALDAQRRYWKFVAISTCLFTAMTVLVVVWSVLVRGS